ncbi:MAG TPA: DUF309 domain-containing protein [Kofleriaceae bacterium]|jgi:hypothetical protein|nr:DUF309 domain-containing protein [Kofleriaceae bacterium]
MTARAAPRYSSRPLPPTAFVPGVSKRADRPAPSRSRPAPVDLDALSAHDDFRYGVDLFNHDFPWEAHEAWEPLWFAAARERPERALLQGLIHAAAAVVKARAGAHHAARGLVESACKHLSLSTTTMLDVPDFIAALTAWADDPARAAPAIVLASPAGRNHPPGDVS